MDPFSHVDVLFAYQPEDPLNHNCDEVLFKDSVVTC